MKTSVAKIANGLAGLPEGSITAIVPARNEEATIAACVKSLALQPEIAEILVVDDQSDDGTATVVRNLTGDIPQLRLLATRQPPPGWIGKNNAAATGAREARGEWLLFVDADAELLVGAAARALELAKENKVALVSFSPEQLTGAWYEKALIPFVYYRLAKHFSYEAVNNPQSRIAAANGQFLTIRRDVYEAVGGHAAVAEDILEDVALAKLVKGAGHRLWFGSGLGMVRVRMYRSFAAMWSGWKKNLYMLVGGQPKAFFREVLSAMPWIPFILIVIGLKYPLPLIAGLGLLLARQAEYGFSLSRNRYPPNFIFYYVPGVILYGSVLWASYRAYTSGVVQWKGREVAVRARNGSGESTPAATR